MRFLVSQCLVLFTAAAMLAVVGCSDGSKDGPMSMDEALARIEQSKNDSKVPPPPVPESEEEEYKEDEFESPPAVKVPASGTYVVQVESSAGDYTIEVHRDWAPIGADRFYQLVKAGYYDECRYFRVVPGFMVQFGMHGDPATHREWDRNIRDDAVKQSNNRGFVTFATSGQHSRTTQIFINYSNNARLDDMGFSPFGKVIAGMENVEAINPKYGESPDQGDIENRGNAYLQQSFPELDYVKKMTIVSETPG